MHIAQGREQTCEPYRGHCRLTVLWSRGAERDIAAGEQVLISYGELSDAKLLQTYGKLPLLRAPATKL